MGRKLTAHFGAYAVGKYCKKNNISMMQLLDIGDFDINKIADLIRLGNSITMEFKDNDTPEVRQEKEEAPYKKLDEYFMADENNSAITAYFDIMEEMDLDIKILKTCGISVKKLKDEFSTKAYEMGKQFEEKLKEVNTNEAGDNKVVSIEKKLTPPVPPALD